MVDTRFMVGWSCELVFDKPTLQDSAFFPRRVVVSGFGQCRLNTPFTGESDKLSGTITWRRRKKELACHSGSTLSAS
jgi:hypothetical protein